MTIKNWSTLSIESQADTFNLMINYSTRALYILFGFILFGTLLATVIFLCFLNIVRVDLYICLGGIAISMLALIVNLSKQEKKNVALVSYSRTNEDLSFSKSRINISQISEILIERIQEDEVGEMNLYYKEKDGKAIRFAHVNDSAYHSIPVLKKYFTSLSINISEK